MSSIFVLAFSIGRRFLRTPADSEEILRALVIAGLVYSLPMLFEMRFSPQLHNWIYGFHPSEFLQEMREEGFRPMVFTGHGLLAAFFMMTTMVAAATLWRIRVRAVNLPPAGVTAYLAVMLVLCKSGAALVYGMVLAPLVRFASARLQTRVAVMLVVVALAFPLLRTADLFPTTTLVDAASEFSPERASSLEFRFNHEQRLLKRESERFWFGWGRYGRSRVYDEYGGDLKCHRWLLDHHDGAIRLCRLYGRVLAADLAGFLCGVGAEIYRFAAGEPFAGGAGADRRHRRHRPVAEFIGPSLDVADRGRALWAGRSSARRAGPFAKPEADQAGQCTHRAIGQSLPQIRILTLPLNLNRRANPLRCSV